MAGDCVAPLEEGKKMMRAKVEYRRSFERQVLEGKINVARNFLSMGALLLSTSLPLLLEFTDYVSEEEALWMKVLTAVAIVVLAATFAMSNNIVFRMYAPYARRMLHQHIVLFMIEVELDLGYVKQREDNFVRRSVDEVAALLQKSTYVKDDDNSLADEFTVLDFLDLLAHRLRDETFTLGDLQIFYSISDVVVMEDSPFLDAMVRLREELAVVNSIKLASFVRSAGLGWWSRASLSRELESFGTFVMTGTGLGEETDEVNSWVELFIRSEKDTLAGPNVVWASRFAAFLAHQLAKSGSYAGISFLKMLLAEWECFDFEVFTNSSCQKYTLMDEEAVPITIEAIKAVELTPELRYRKGFFGSESENAIGNLHAFETDELLLVYRTYATVEYATLYKMFSVHRKEKLIGLIKPKTSAVMHTMVDFSAHSLVYEKLIEAEQPAVKIQWKQVQGGASAYDACVQAMDKMILRPSSD